MDMQGNVQTIVELPFFPASFAVQRDGALVVGDALRRTLYQCESGDLKLTTDLGDTARCYLGECVIDYRGGIYIGDAGFDVLNPLVDPVPSGVIVYVSACGVSTIVADNLFLPRGLVVTKDNATLIVAENLRHRLTAFDIEGDGSLQNRRLWAQVEPDVRPDGICLDLEDAIWVAGGGLRALRVREGGEIDQQVTTERPVFSIALGGPRRRRLFLCTAESGDPVITRRTPGASIEVADVAIAKRQCP